MQDIQEIKKELKGYEEIDITYPLNRKCYIKYITLHDNQEYFYDGGYFNKMGFDKIVLKNNDNKLIRIKTIYKDNDGKIIYKSRFFLKKNDNEIKEECEEDKKE